MTDSTYVVFDGLLAFIGLCILKQLLGIWDGSECILLMQVEIKTTPETPDQAYLQKAADFIHAFILGVHTPMMPSLW